MKIDKLVMAAIHSTLILSIISGVMIKYNKGEKTYRDENPREIG